MALSYFKDFDKSSNELLGERSFPINSAGFDAEGSSGNQKFKVAGSQKGADVTHNLELSDECPDHGLTTKLVSKTEKCKKRDKVVPVYTIEATWTPKKVEGLKVVHAADCSSHDGEHSQKYRASVIYNKDFQSGAKVGAGLLVTKEHGGAVTVVDEISTSYKSFKAAVQASVKIQKGGEYQLNLWGVKASYAPSANLVASVSHTNEADRAKDGALTHKSETTATLHYKNAEKKIELATSVKADKDVVAGKKLPVLQAALARTHGTATYRARITTGEKPLLALAVKQQVSDNLSLTVVSEGDLPSPFGDASARKYGVAVNVKL